MAECFISMPLDRMSMIHCLAEPGFFDWPWPGNRRHNGFFNLNQFVSGTEFVYWILHNNKDWHGTCLSGVNASMPCYTSRTWVLIMHWYGFSPLWTRTCVFRLSFLVIRLPNVIYINGFFPVWIRRCVWSQLQLRTNCFELYEHRAYMDYLHCEYQNVGWVWCFRRNSHHIHILSNGFLRYACVYVET